MTALGRLGRTVAGALLVLLGIVLVPLPGPGFLVVLAGLVMLAKDYRWAQSLTDQLRERADRAADAAKQRLSTRTTKNAVSANEGEQS